MPLIKCVAHACLRSTDLEKTAAFYCGSLGMERLFQFTRAGKVIGFYLKASAQASGGSGSPTSFIEVFHADAITPGADNRALHHFCLETSDIEATRQRLVDRGYAPGGIKMGADHSLQFWVKDPSGVDLELHQYTPESSQISGADVEVDW